MKDKRLEEKKKARKAAKAKRQQNLGSLQSSILSLGKKVEGTKPGSKEEKSLLKRRARFIKAFNRSKESGQ